MMKKKANIENISASDIAKAYSEMDLKAMRKKCREHSKNFSLENKAEKILEKYNEASN